MTFDAINGLSSLLVITSLLVVTVPRMSTTAWLYALQSLVLVILFAALGSLNHSPQLYNWAISAFVTKVILVPAIFLYTLKRIGPMPDDAGIRLPPAVVALFVAIVVGISYLLVSPLSLVAIQPVKLALAVSLAHFFIGVICIIVQRNLFKQALGYCLMENGSHLSLALLAGSAPEIVEIGIATDALFAVIIMAVLAFQISRVCKSLDVDQLSKLRE